LASLRNWVRKLEREAKGEALLQIPQEFGDNFVMERSAAVAELFSYYCECAVADGEGEPRSDPPEVLRAIANARDRRAALANVMQGYRFLPVSATTLIEEGLLEPVSLVARLSYEEVLERGRQ
jgi:hypothetical protein